MPKLPKSYSPEAGQDLESDGLVWTMFKARLPMGRIRKITCVITNCFLTNTPPPLPVAVSIEQVASWPQPNLPPLGHKDERSAL